MTPERQRHIGTRSTGRAFAGERGYATRTNDLGHASASW